VAELLALCFFSKYISSQKVKELLLFTFFSVLGVWTRQTATIVFFSGICWLLLNRKFKPALLSGFLWGMINLTVLFLLYQRFGPSLFDHILFSNIRVWKSFDSSLFTTSLFSYFASMIVFGGLLYSYFKRNRLEKNSIPQFYFLCLLIGSCVGSISYFRSGGDVNYLFFPVLAGTYFTLPILEHWMSRPFKLGLIVLQLVLISFVYFQKSKAALKYSQLPYPQMAQEIKSRYPGYGLIVGHYAQNMGIYLKDWAYHGPDLTNGTMLAYSAHLKLNWLVADAKSAIRENKITALVDANPNCALGPSLNGEWFLSFPKREILADWLCVYNRN
jgi:hypothetical protein